MAREINLVPDIKDEMIKALKLRNLIFFLCIAVSVAAIGVVIVLGGIVGGQSAALNAKQNTLKEMSKTINSYDDLSDFLTIKDQLGKLSAISENKNVLSRTFGILGALLPKGADVITISELTVNLDVENPTLTFEAQANAGEYPYIDYNVLDAFKKSMPYMKYDYGRYRDKNGNDIPTYCMIESGVDGATFADEEKGIYALWTITKDGCYTREETDGEDEPAEVEDYGYALEEYEGEQVVRVWREVDANEDENLPYFESACNGECYLVPDGVDGIMVTESSNGRDSDGELVLRFTATITLTPEVYKFENKHMLAVAPSGRFNVTDSYMQIQAMFSARAVDCLETDASCKDGGN